MKFINEKDLERLAEASKVFEEFSSSLEEMATKYLKSKGRYYFSNTLNFEGVDLSRKVVNFIEITHDYDDGMYESDLEIPLAFVLEYKEWFEAEEKKRLEKEKKDLELKLIKQEEKRKKQAVSAQVKKEKLLEQLDNLYAKYPNLK